MESQGFPNFATPLLDPFEAQGRGFTHGHKKVMCAPTRERQWPPVPRVCAAWHCKAGDGDGQGRGGKLQRCSTCRGVLYCSTDCQVLLLLIVRDILYFLFLAIFYFCLCL